MFDVSSGKKIPAAIVTGSTGVSRPQEQDLVIAFDGGADGESRFSFFRFLSHSFPYPELGKSPP